MKKKDILNIVIFGASGNLYADKLAKALFLIFQDGVLTEDFKIIAFARKDITTQDFQSLTKDFILKRGDADISKLDDFISHVEYFKGDFSNKDDFTKLKDYLSLGQENAKDRLTVFHLATASFLYEKIFENMKDSNLHNLDGNVRLMIEKPFGKDENNAEHLNKILTTLFKEEDIFNIDHYLAKETARAVFNFRFKDMSLEPVWNGENISKVKIIFNESNIVGSRGASYDKVGAFRDVGENHMLELLSLVVMDKPEREDALSIRDSRVKALEDLYVDYTEPITKGQYQSYLSSGGVDTNSKTETFFRIFLKSHSPKFKDTVFEFEGGKGLIDMGSDITTTTVAINVDFKDGKNLENKEFKIQPVLGTVYESYTKVYIDVLAGDQTLFVSMPEIMSQWRLADELLEKWKDIPLVIYKDGIDPKDIKL